VHEIAERLGPVARALLDCWSALPARDCVPDRDAFDPMAIKDILPVVSLIERIEEDAAWRFRLVGTEIERRWDRRLTGRDVLEVVSPEVGRIMQQELHDVVVWPCGAWSRRRVSFRSGRTGALETLRLPLRARDGTVRLVLGCSGELHDRSVAVGDAPREIVTVAEHQYVDIGAGRPPHSALDAITAREIGAGYRSMPSAPAGTS
jgi:hypothetical protein